MTLKKTHRNGSIKVRKKKEIENKCLSDAQENISLGLENIIYTGNRKNSI